VTAKLPVIKVVGVSASGKSTLVAGLRNAGYDAYPVSQEHSNVADLWKQFGIPRVLIYLDVSLDAQKERRPDVTWDATNRTTEIERLAHARDHADLQIDTSHNSAEQVRRIVLAYLEGKRIRRADSALPPVGQTGASVKPVTLAQATETQVMTRRKRHRDR
jgi:hypothetical protein